MRRGLLLVIIYCLGIGIADATVRNPQNTRTNTQNIVNRTATANQNRLSTPSTPATTKNTRTTTKNSVSGRVATKNVINNSSRSATQNIRLANTIARAARPQNNNTTRTPVARATIIPDVTQTATFGTDYNTCRDAYFTCMDQFCAKQNDTYRRCVCSSRLADVQSRERALAQTADKLESFSDLNLDVINKTGAQVTAMLNATDGENAIKKDTSDSAKKLSGISDVLSKTKKNALNTNGNLDIAGDINAIWATTDLTSGANISELSGEALYNAVHAQCAELMTNYCPSNATKTMVISAYGMYIENDCSALLTTLNQKQIQANSTIRNTEHDMHQKRLENYKSHNSTSISDCISMVYDNITADTACGKNYVHCLDITGRYLNRTTGAPIYTPDFYKLEDQLSLSGDILNNDHNHSLVDELNNMRPYAEISLQQCADQSDNVWDDFMRQAIREIYQKQQDIVRQAKENCMNVVTKCYDEQTQKLRVFSNVKEQLLLGEQMELSEELCRDKLNSCSKLYNNNEHLLVQTIYDIVNQKIAMNCRKTLQEYLEEKCAAAINDTVHYYPYGCRAYTPGNQNCVPRDNTTPENCDDYTGSLYDTMVRYAKSTCLRPSLANDESTPLPTSVLNDVNVVMDDLRLNMTTSLAAECDRQGGVWVSAPDKNAIQLKRFYEKTGANTSWGQCVQNDDGAQCIDTGGNWINNTCLCDADKNLKQTTDTLSCECTNNESQTYDATTRMCTETSPAS